MEPQDDRARQVEHARARVDAFSGVLRAEREWADVLQVFFDEATPEDAQRRLVSRLGFTDLQASVVTSMNFFRLVGAERESAAGRLEEARGALAAILAEAEDAPRA